MKDVELEVALGQRGQPKRRLLGVVLVGLLVLVTISGVIVTVNPGAPAALGDMLYGTSTPTATLAPGSNLVYYENGAPWGTFTIDGRSIPINATPKLAVLDRGRHTLTYRADPFPPLHCTISTPAAASDTCPLDATFASRIGHPMYGNRAVNLGSTLERLPAAQRDALIALVRGKVEDTSPVTTVRTGEHYEGIHTDSITLETASQPLNATIQIRLANASTGNVPGGDPVFACALVCTPPYNSAAPGFPNLLEVWAHVKVGYHYTAQDGSVVLDYAPLRPMQEYAWRPDGNISVYVGWNGAWQITRPTGDDTPLPCTNGGVDFTMGAGNYPTPLYTWENSRSAPSPSDTSTSIYTLVGSRSAPNPTDGCLVIVHHVVRQQSGDKMTASPVLFLDRFGVLLAVGDDAHQARPQLPAASPLEADEAYTIAAQGPLP